MKWYAQLLFIFVVFLPEGAHTQTKEDYEDILYEIFTTRGYNKNALPRLNFSQPVYLDVSLNLMGIEEIDEEKEKMISTGYLEIFWEDPGLVWDSVYFGNLKHIYVRQDDIWIPDIFLVNGAGKFSGFGGSFYYVRIDSNGLAHWLPFDVFESRCSLDTRYFPFDQQSCTLRFSVWTHAVYDVKIRLRRNGIQLDRIYTENSVWKVESTSYIVNDQFEESNVIFTFNLERKSLYFVINIVFPIVFLGFLSGFVFVIPIESGEKIGYSVTVF